MSDGKPNEKDIMDMIKGLGEKIMIFKDCAQAVKKLRDAHPEGTKNREATVSALVHICAQLMHDEACCAFHALEVWEEVGKDVIANCKPGEEPQWEDPDNPGHPIDISTLDKPDEPTRH